MNNLLSYCGLVDARIRASNKDLPVHTTYWYDVISNNQQILFLQCGVIECVTDAKS